MFSVQLSYVIEGGASRVFYIKDAAEGAPTMTIGN
jgi:hypothetical protein